MMHSARVFAMSNAPQGRQAPPPPPPPPSAGEVEQQVREAIGAAQNAARDAQRQAERAEGRARAEGGGGERIIRIGPGGIQGGREGGGFPGQRGGRPGGEEGGGIPPQVAEISIAFFVMCAVMVIGWPIARAFGKRIERKGDTAVVAPAMTEQLQRIEQAVDAMSIEVERISESQRFIARLESERLPQAADRS